MPKDEPASASNTRKAAIHWFRHGLRLHDNPALLEAIKFGTEVYPLFIFDGEVAGTKTSGYNRMRFLRECLVDLDNKLKIVGGRLYVFQGDPVNIFSNLIEEWGVGCITFEQDPEPVWHERDHNVKKLCIDKGVKCVEMVSHNLWDPREIIKNNGGKPPLTYTLFVQVATSLGDPPKPVAEADFSSVSLPHALGHDKRFSIPTLEALGSFPECDEQLERVNEWVGGESQAQSRFKYRMRVEEAAFMSGDVMPNQSRPDLVGPPLSMSAYLRFGCISVRTVYWSLRDTYDKLKTVKPFSVSVVGQLYWREYFYTMSIDNIHFNKMEGNPICLQIPWYNEPEKFEKWSMGKTGFPWIDAAMRQLRYEGWIHHVARHAVSTFLTRGDLWLNWVDGLEVLDKYLLDADWSVNAGNWMWMSSSAFECVLQCPKCFCPVRYGRKMDPTGAYVKRYCPELKDMPLRYLFEPWKAPKAVQEKAQCIVGENYPWPMVDHMTASKECFNLMMDVKKKLLSSGKSYEHCGPGNKEEVSSFCWIPGTHIGDPECGKVSDEMICDGLKGL